MHSYSQRLPWSLPPNRLAELIEELRQAGAPLFDLTLSNPTHALENYPHDQIRQAYARVVEFRYEPHPFGSLEARQAVSAEYGRRGISVSADRIALTASTSEAYALLFKLLCNAGEDILVPAPSYPLFEFLARLECVRVVPYRLVYDGSWYIDFTDLRNQITAATRAVVLVNPNNPTGSFIKPDELMRLSELVIEHELPVISDEVFMDYAVAGTESVKTVIGSAAQLTFCLNGLSKMAGMPQVKLGWIVLDGPERLLEDARRRLELLLDTYLSVNVPTQLALGDLFAAGHQVRTELLARVTQNIAFLQNELAGTAIHVLRTEGGWSAILQVPRVMPEQTWVERLLTEQHVVAQPGYFFDMDSEAYLVVSLISKPEILAEGIRRLLLLLAQS